MKSPRIKIIDEDEKSVKVIVWFRDDDMSWLEIKLKIPKDRLKII